MNIGKLMAAGKSVINGRGKIAYRPGKITVPKFGAAKNPFIAPEQKELPAQPEKISQSAKPATSWTAKLNPMTILRSPEEKNPLQPVVQAELSLDAVKVVHNDLTDADVEVVPIKSRSVQEIPELKPAKQSWEMLGERLLRVAVH